MSYDFSLDVKTGKVVDGKEVYTTLVDYWTNMTSNVAPIWDLAFARSGLQWQLRHLGYKHTLCSEVVDDLETASTWLTQHAHDPEVQALQPENNWGSVEGAERTLRKIAAWCREHPLAYLWVSN